MSSRPLPDFLRERSDLWLGGRAAAIPAQASGHPALDRLLPGGGWPQGALSEILLARPGTLELRLILPLLARLSATGQRVCLVSPPQIPYAPALARAGVDLQNCWIVEPESNADRVWALEQLLRCPGVGAVAGWLDQADERVQRRLQLAAETAGSVGLLIRPEAARQQPSVAALRLSLQPGPSVEILKSRGGRVGQRARLAAA